MMRNRLAVALVASALGGCDVSVKGDAAGGNAAGGEVSIKAPGLNLDVDLPATLKAELGGGGGDLIFPGATMSGVNITAGTGQSGNVQLSFTTPAAVQEVVAWYRDPARAVSFGGVTVRQDGAGYRISGTAAEGNGPFDLSLTPGAGGGTQGQLSLNGS